MQPYLIPISHGKNAMGKYALDYLAQKMIAGKILEKKEYMYMINLKAQYKDSIIVYLCHIKIK